MLRYENWTEESSWPEEQSAGFGESYKGEDKSR
jgi:hypothetical protein